MPFHMIRNSTEAMYVMFVQTHEFFWQVGEAEVEVCCEKVTSLEAVKARKHKLQEQNPQTDPYLSQISPAKTLLWLLVLGYV